MKLVELIPNQPQELSLGSEISPVKLSQGAGCLYTLSDGRLLHLSGPEADDLTLLKLQPGETFRICLHEKPGVLPYRSVWLSPETEKARAEAEAPELERQLRESLQLVERRKAAIPDVLAPTGTDGPAFLPARKPALAAIATGGRKRQAGEPIPMNIAFREITRFVVSELKTAGEQWADQAKQDAICSIFISAQRAGLLGVWEREAA